MNKNQSLIKIDSVSPAKKDHYDHKPEGKSITDILKIFNPFEGVGNTIKEIFAYKIECKRLDAEIKQIKEQARIHHHLINKEFKIKMEQLARVKEALILKYQTLNTQLERSHIERIEFLKMIQSMQNRMFEKGLSIEERKILKEMIIEMFREMSNFTNNLIDETIKSLSHIEISSKMKCSPQIGPVIKFIKIQKEGNNEE